MAVHGVGIDVVDASRVERMLARSARFAHRWFSPSEFEQCSGTPQPFQAFAQRLAAKEAVWKALGLDAWTGGVPWRQIETSNGRAGLEVELTGAVLKASDQIVLGRIYVAIAHSHGRAVAIAVVEVAEMSRSSFPSTTHTSRR